MALYRELQLSSGVLFQELPGWNERGWKLRRAAVADKRICCASGEPSPKDPRTCSATKKCVTAVPKEQQTVRTPRRRSGSSGGSVGMQCCSVSWAHRAGRADTAGFSDRIPAGPAEQQQQPWWPSATESGGKYRSNRGRRQTRQVGAQVFRTHRGGAGPAARGRRAIGRTRTAGSRLILRSRDRRCNLHSLRTARRAPIASRARRESEIRLPRVTRVRPRAIFCLRFRVVLRFPSFARGFHGGQWRRRRLRFCDCATRSSEGPHRVTWHFAVSRCVRPSREDGASAQITLKTKCNKLTIPPIHPRRNPTTSQQSTTV